ncbi:MAG: hypothetical protein R2764_17735 [Bacteroidales bacterium]
MKNLLVLLVLVFGITALNAQEKSAKDYKVEGAEAYNAKDYKTGLAAFESSIKLYEQEGNIDTTLYYNAAICAMKINDYEKSVTYFDRSIELDYKSCNAQLYKANALKKLNNYDTMIEVCESGITACPKYKSKFNELLFGYYLKSGLDIFNDAAKMQAEATPLATSDPAKYKTEMEKVKAEFNKSLPMLEKAKAINPDDENCNRAINQAKEIIATDI